MRLLAPGTGLKKTRLHLGLTTREVAERSRVIAEQEKNIEFAISHARLVQIENNESTPSVYKLFTLSAIYGIEIDELFQLYLNLDALAQYQLSFDHKRTRPIGADAHGINNSIEFPVEFQRSASLVHTGLLAELVKVWGHLPLGLLRHVNLRKQRYAIIGLSDYMMYPLLRPGSIVQIDDTNRPEPPRRYSSEYDRPLYFVETRERYLCCWCELTDGRLIVVPHPLSSYRTTDYKYPEEAEIVGRVTGMVIRLNRDESASRTADGLAL